MRSRRFYPALMLAGLTAVYFVAGKLGLKLAFVNASASPVWPPAGIALGALLLLGYRAWPAIFLGAFLVNLSTAGNAATSVAIGAGNTLEAICGAWLVNRFAGGLGVFDRAENVFGFAVAAMISTAIAPSVGVTSLALAGFADWHNYGAVWLTWWLGDASGDLIVAPVIILWAMAPSWRWSRREALEVGLLFVLLVLLGETVFGGWFPITAESYPISFICGPVLVWTAFRFAQRETATGIFILCAIAIWGTLHNYGPFVMRNENQSLLILQSSTAVLTLTAMALAAAMAERRRASAALEQQKAVVEAANRTKDNFLAMLSHELRTPLTPVVAALGILERELWQNESKSALAMIRRNIDVESRLIDDLLDLTRISKGKLELKFERVDAHEPIAQVLEMCAPEAEGKRLCVQGELRAAHHHVEADPTKFQQIIWNLLRNAIKFNKQGSSVTIASSNETPETLTITVSDAGVGIAPEVMPRIFEPFERAGRSFQQGFGGLGLGLAISKSLAEAHGASLTAKSDGVDRGATFSLTIKTAAPPERSAHVAETPSHAPTGAFRILLVEDHADTCAALKRLLAQDGHTVATAHSLHSAMERAKGEAFDVLISDVGLPDGTGMELMTRLAATSPMRGIAISGFGTSDDIERSLQAGFSQHLVKPLKAEELAAAVQAVMTPSRVRT
ncbi:MAG: MASE1 domain-containing protein [Chthoniobacterales bacterium]